MDEGLKAPLGSKMEKQAFYRMVFMLVLPIAAQNLINTAVSSADVVMLKYVGQNALAAVSAATAVFVDWVARMPVFFKNSEH